MIPLPNYHQKFSQAIEAYFACQDKDDREILACILTLELQNLRNTEATLENIVSGNMDALREMHQKHKQAILKQVLAFLATGSADPSLNAG